SVTQKSDLGCVASYNIDGKSANIQFINEELEAGAPPCHLEITENDLVTGNYHKGIVDLYQVDQQGALETKSSAVQHEGSGPHDRQESPHVHYTAHTPDGKYIIVADLGTDELVTYKIENNQLVKVHTLNVKAGSGPRHIVFHPNGKTAYLLTELASEVVVLDYHASEGSFTEKQYIPAIPEDFTETNDAGAIHISSDGKFLYTSNRGHNSIAVFSINQDNFELTFVEYTPTDAEWLRDVILDTSEADFAVVYLHT